LGWWRRWWRWWYGRGQSERKWKTIEYRRRDRTSQAINNLQSRLIIEYTIVSLRHGDEFHGSVKFTFVEGRAVSSDILPDFEEGWVLRKT